MLFVAKEEICAGSIVVNVISEDSPQFGSHWQKLVRMFTSVFPMCMEIALKKRLNVFFACVANPRSSMLQTRLTSSERFHSLASRLHVSQILNGVTFRML
ncbi:hypothetical protein Y032_0026g1477 [Ancylostoma ceylanicum]|uniref:Uncharacterized protein n=1 Tax=Ancylostoma ceylanicum TaxID=53326 RepID=A0A016UUU1_9BILA|nr:hypothetical protein Y032_0026g1477 [Ancylostoma ceylanicum]